MRHSRYSPACFGFYTWLWLVGLSLATAPPGDFDWSAITPTPDLQYHSCYEGFRCARLAVPRDWLDDDSSSSSSSSNKNNKTVALAVISLPATVAPDDPSFGGTIITNPGGPGGSGVGFLTGPSGRLLQRMTDGRKHYEILSFDPRGVGSTRPEVDCFGAGHAFARDAYQLELRATGGMDASESSLRRSLALFDGYDRLCEARDGDEGILRYLSTASVARDIVEIADRVEEQRRAERKSARSHAVQHPMGDGEEEDRKVPSRVLYWGFSYGTILGNTLASMFPGRMGRVVLDGVVDIHDYMGAHWLRNLQDAEKIVEYFYESCFEASDGCPLWKDGDASGDDIKSRVDGLIAEADEQPLVFVADDGTSNVRAITGNDIRTAFKTPVYRPLPTAFEDLAAVLAEALRGNYSRLGHGLEVPRLEDSCTAGNGTLQVRDDAQAAILCGDASRHTLRHDFSHWQDYVARLKGQSPTMGPWWSTIPATCSGWLVTPKWIFTGPWTTPPADSRGLGEGVPAAPILFTSTRLDPVTPLANANRMSSDHPGSAVLMLNSTGHCAMGNGWSECFNAAIRAYFDDGIVPENGTVCADTGCQLFAKDGKCQAPQEISAAGGGGEAQARTRGYRPLEIPF